MFGIRKNSQNWLCVACSQNYEFANWCTSDFTFKLNQLAINSEKNSKNNSYGPECNETCGSCLIGFVCNTSNGICNQGCSPGYNFTHDDTCKTSKKLPLHIDKCSFFAGVASFVCFCFVFISRVCVRVCFYLNSWVLLCNFLT